MRNRVEALIALTIDEPRFPCNSITRMTTGFSSKATLDMDGDTRGL